MCHDSFIRGTPHSYVTQRIHMCRWAKRSYHTWSRKAAGCTSTQCNTQYGRKCGTTRKWGTTRKCGTIRKWGTTRKWETARPLLVQWWDTDTEEAQMYQRTGAARAAITAGELRSPRPAACAATRRGAGGGSGSGRGRHSVHRGHVWAFYHSGWCGAQCHGHRRMGC